MSKDLKTTDKAIGQMVSLPTSWWEVIETFELGRSKYFQSLVNSDFRSRGIFQEDPEVEELTVLREAKNLGINIIELAREEIRKKEAVA